MPSSPKLFEYQMLEIGGESTFATASSNLDYVETAGPITPAITQESLRNPKVRQVTTQFARVIGKRNGEVTIRLRGHGYSTSGASLAAAPSITASTDAGATAWDHIMAIMASALGNVMAGGYDGAASLAATGAPTDTLQATDLSSFTEGQAVLWATGNTALPYEVGWLESITPGTPDEGGLLFTPLNDPQGNTLWGSHTAFLKTGDPYHSSGAKSFTLKLTSEDQILTMVGCRPRSCRFEASVGQEPFWDVSFSVAYWTLADGSGLPSEGTYNYPEAEAALQWTVRLDGTDVPSVDTFSVDFGLTQQVLPDGYFAGGIGGYYTSAREPVITMGLYSEDSGDVSDFQSQSVMPFSAQIGSLPGRMIAFCAPQVTIAELPGRENRDGSPWQSFELRPIRYTGDSGTASNSSPVDTDLRVAWL